MPLPLILGAGAAIAGITGLGAGANGAYKMKKANDTMKAVNKQHEENIKRFKKHNTAACKLMDELGTLELKILNNFEFFSDTIEKIQNRPYFKEYKKDGIELPKYDKEELKGVSVGAGVLLGGLGGAAVGTAGGFAAAGATTSAVMALGTASTGTAIASLSGAAATNATLAALGGGALAAGGGGMALGTMVLGGATLGVGLLVGGIIFNFTGGKLSSKADKARDQMLEAEEKINKICRYLNNLSSAAKMYTDALSKVYDVYKKTFACVSDAVYRYGKTDWNEFTGAEKTAAQNSVLLVGLLYKMCKVELVRKTKEEDGINTINRSLINNTISDSNTVLESL